MSSKPRPTPGLADLYLAQKMDGGRIDGVLRYQSAYEQVRGKLRRARRFVLDAAAVQRYAETVRDIPDLIVQNQESALPPYDLMWVEFDFATFYTIVTGRASGADATVDRQLGYLFDHNDVFVVSGDDANAKLFPAYYTLHTEWPAAEQEAFCRHNATERGVLGMFGWGEAYQRVDPRVRAQLTDQNVIGVIPIGERHRMTPPQTWEVILRSGAGDLRNIIALLLLMNRPSLTKYVRDIPRGKGWINRQMRPFMEHTIVTIDVDPQPTLHQLGTSLHDAAARRRHEVRGHFCHSGTARQAAAIGCLHSWQLVAGHDQQWECATCHGKRWWKKSHVRGSAAVGYVDKDYVLTD